MRESTATQCFFVFRTLVIFSIKNIKSDVRAIKIINIIYTALFSSGALLSLIKMLLFFLGVG